MSKVREAVDREGSPGPVAASFDVFYRDELTQAARLAWLLTRSSAVAEDLAQEAFVSLQRNWGRVENPQAYLRKAIVNQARSWQRDERRRAVKAVRLGRERSPFDPDDVELFDMVGSLPYRQRVVIVARYWGGWSETEIAAALGCRPGTVKSLASRALEQLRREVER